MSSMITFLFFKIFYIKNNLERKIFLYKTILYINK